MRNQPVVTKYNMICSTGSIYWVLISVVALGCTRYERLADADEVSTLQMLSERYWVLTHSPNKSLNELNQDGLRQRHHSILSRAFQIEMRRTVGALGNQIRQQMGKALSEKELDLRRRLLDRIERWKTKDICDLTSWLAFSPLIIEQHINGLSHEGRAKFFLETSVRLVQEEIKNLRRGVSNGRLASRSYLRQTADGIDGLQFRLHQRMNRNKGTGTPSSSQTVHNRSNIRSVHEVLNTLKTFILDEMLPKASTHSWLSTGLKGKSCYVHLIKSEIGQDLSPAAAHSTILNLASVYRKRLAGLAQNSLGLTLIALLRRNPVMPPAKSVDRIRRQFPSLEELTLPLTPPDNSQRRSQIYALFKTNSLDEALPPQARATSWIRLLRHINRAIADLGIHSRGWNLKYALQFLNKKGGISEEAALTEIDDILNRPGLAVVDILHAHRLLRLQRRARVVLGDGFDTEAFDRIVAPKNQESLPVITSRFKRWLGRPSGVTER